MLERNFNGLLMQGWQKETDPQRRFDTTMNDFYTALNVDDFDLMKDMRIDLYGDVR